MPCNCNVRVRATPPSAQAESQTVVQRLRQQAGRSRQAARQAAPACSRPFELVGTLTARFPSTYRGRRKGRKQGCERCRIPQKRTKFFNRFYPERKRRRSSRYYSPVGRPLVRRRSRAPRRPGEHAGLTQGSSYGRALQCLKDRDQQVLALGAPVEMGAPGYVEMGEPGYVTSIRALVAHATG